MFRKLITLSVVLLLGMMPITVAQAKTEDEAVPADQEKKITIEEKWGVKVESLRTSANGNLLDFRYRIIDPEKAFHLVDRRNKPYLIDQASGRVLSVPNTAKVGPLRQTVRYGLPKKDRVYFVLFGNPHVINPGDKVTVVIGDFRAENIVVDKDMLITPPSESKE